MTPFPYAPGDCVRMIFIYGGVMGKSIWWAEGGHKLRMRKEHERRKRRRRRRRNRGDRVREAIVRRDKGEDCGRERKEIERVVWGREVGTTNSTL